ncbi:MAG: S24 family peptidase [Actinomycetes bacterium]
MRRWSLVRVRGASMAPTLADGDLLLLRHGLAGRPGDVAVVRLPGDRPTAVKRLVHRDGDAWWVERDNPRVGVDSWTLGVPVPAGAVVGIVRVRLWPWPSRV